MVYESKREKMITKKNGIARDASLCLSRMYSVVIASETNEEEVSCTSCRVAETGQTKWSLHLIAVQCGSRRNARHPG